jgi:hypothetical protein
MGPIYLPHSTHAELRGDFVDAEAGAGREGQVIFVDYTGGTDGRTGILLPDAAVSSDPDCVPVFETVAHFQELLRD